jgi:hypothetical protein
MMSRLEMAVFAYCLLVVGVGLAYFPMYCAIRFFRPRRRQARSFLDVIGKAPAAQTASDWILIEHPPLITVGRGPSIDPPRGAEDEPHRSKQHEERRARPLFSGEISF